MFEDITNEKKDVLKEELGLNLTTELDANAIAQKIIEKYNHNSCVKLVFKTEKYKNKILKMTMTHNNKVSEYYLQDNDTLKFTHSFNVEL